MVCWARHAIIDLSDAAVQESNNRVQIAVCNVKLDFPHKCAIVNLALTYDLPIALIGVVFNGNFPY